MLNPDPTKWPTAPFVESTPAVIPAIQTACLACHDGTDAKAHAETQTTASGAEACGVCHEEGRIEAVSEVHALP
jgi:predicted CXXCH cytochrome family protein